MGDVIETNLISQGKDRVKSNLEFSEEYLVMMQPLYEMVDWSVNQAINSIVDNSEITAQKIIDAKPEISALRNQIFDYISSRLSVEKNLSLTEFRLQSDIIENLMRIYYQAKRIAHVILFISSEKSAKKYKYVQEEISFED
jgi:Na+/phosphate symporter